MSTPNIPPTLSVEKLQCIRDERILFENLSFTLNAGEILQIEGANGSGKTSLLRLLCGLTPPTEGTIYWTGQDIQTLGTDYYTNLSYLGHHNGVKTDLTALENLKIAAALTQRPPQITYNAALTKIGLADFEDARVRTLSAGQQRRVALARLLLHPTPLWILDEPFTALDKTTITMLEGILDKHVAHGGMIILTSHHHVRCTHLRTLALTE